MVRTALPSAGLPSNARQNRHNRVRSQRELLGDGNIDRRRRRRSKQVLVKVLVPATLLGPLMHAERRLRFFVGLGIFDSSEIVQSGHNAYRFVVQYRRLPFKLGVGSRAGIK